MRGYEELVVWQKAMTVAVEAHRFTDEFPAAERHGIVAQIRRAAVSVPANIAEGQGRESIREFRHHVSIARGSAAELSTLVQLSARLGLSPVARSEALLQRAREVGRMLSGLLNSLPDRPPSRRQTGEHPRRGPTSD